MDGPGNVCYSEQSSMEVRYMKIESYAVLS